MIPGSWVTCTIAESKTESTECDLGRVYENVIVQLPALTSGTIKLQGAKFSGDTAKDIYIVVPTTGALIQVISAATTGDHMVVYPLGGFRFIKFVSGAEQAAARTIYCQGVRS